MKDLQGAVCTRNGVQSSSETIRSTETVLILLLVHRHIDRQTHRQTDR